MHRTRRNKFSIAVLNRKYEVDGEPVTFRDFINKYFYQVPANKRMATNKARSVVDLEPGESTIIETLNIKRIS